MKINKIGGMTNKLQNGESTTSDEFFKINL